MVSASGIFWRLISPDFLSYVSFWYPSAMSEGERLRSVIEHARKVREDSRKLRAQSQHLRQRIEKQFNKKEQHAGGTNARAKIS